VVVTDGWAREGGKGEGETGRRGIASNLLATIYNQTLTPGASVPTVQVDLLVAFLRKECDAEELDFENDREAKARTTVDRGDTVTTGELTAIQRHPEKFLKSMENLQRKMERLVKKAAENDTAGRLPGLV
jgi:predicted component of type VI protein secretion system